MNLDGVDPYAARPPAGALRFLYRLNPLSPFVAILPATVLLIFTRDLATPSTFLLIGYAIILIGARFTPRLAMALFLAIPLGVCVLGCSFSVWADPVPVADTPVLLQVGSWTLYTGAAQIGFATALRLAAILILGLAAGIATTGPDLVRALIQQLRLPYRIGYTALAAFRFVPRFGYELETIRQAHRVRGASGGRGPFSAAARWFGYVIPLLASAIRHAERVALAMDARAFGAYPQRTERYILPFRASDAVFVVAFWLVSAVILVANFPWVPR